MKTSALITTKLAILDAVVALGVVGVYAFPPAPPHEIYGMVRGEDGEPITDGSVQMILETDRNAQGLKEAVDRRVYWGLGMTAALLLLLAGLGAAAG